MKSSLSFTNNWLLALTVFLLLTTGCTKSSSDNNEPDFGCDSKVVLETLTNTPGVLVYNPTQSEWQISIDLSGNRSFACTFCDKSVYSAITAGQSTSSTINVTVSGTVKRRTAGQIPISPTTGYREVYVINTTTIN